MDELTKELVKEGKQEAPSFTEHHYLIHHAFLSVSLPPPPLLLSPEQTILAQYEQDLEFNEDALCAAIECLTTTDVICPVCQK